MAEARLQILPVAGAAALFAGLVVAASAYGDQRVYAAFLGALCGVALYHASFGFTAGWRRLVRERRGAGFRAQMLLIGLVVVFSYPFLAYGLSFDAFGAEVDLSAQGWVRPLSVASAIGAAMFGIGMQLGGGCGSGVLFTVGGGSTRMILTLVFFVLGSLLFYVTDSAFYGGLNEAAAALGFESTRISDPYSILNEWDPLAAMAGTLTLLLLLAAAAWAYEKRAHGALEQSAAPLWSWRALVRGPWSKTQGAVVLAIGSILTLVALERPWGVTNAYQLWGGHALDALGAPVVEWGAISEGRLDDPIFWDRTSVMNFGLMLGALAAAGLAGRFAPVWRLSVRDVWTAMIGGLLMGYGARLAFGCNIGGLLGGVASGSLHGWWWLLFGWLGSWAGVRLRRVIGMDPASPPPNAPPRRAATP